MKTTVLRRALTLVLVTASLADAQVTTVTGRVTTEAGVGIADVHLYVLGAARGTPSPGQGVAMPQIAETRTAANGTYTIKIPVDRDSRYQELRVRAEGYEPQTATVLAGATVAENFRLKVDTYSARRDSIVRAMYAVVRGKVTTESGVGIDSAQVYINDLNLMVITNASGEYMFETPAVNRMTNLRVRATGYVPAVQIITLAPGSRENNFKLKGDAGGPRYEIPVGTTKTGTRTSAPAMAQGGFATKTSAPTRATEPARATYEMAAAQSLGATSVARAADPFGRLMFTPEQVMQYQNAISLKDSQRETLQAAIQEAQALTIRMQWTLAQDTEKLTQLLSAESLQEKDIMAQTDRIMAIEREIKRAQMILLIKIKNTLTAEQQTKLRQLRGGDE